MVGAGVRFLLLIRRRLRLRRRCLWSFSRNGAVVGVAMLGVDAGLDPLSSKLYVGAAVAKLDVGAAVQNIPVEVLRAIPLNRLLLLLLLLRLELCLCCCLLLSLLLLLLLRFLLGFRLRFIFRLVRSFSTVTVGAVEVLGAAEGARDGMSEGAFDGLAVSSGPRM